MKTETLNSLISELLSLYQAIHLRSARELADARNLIRQKFFDLEQVPVSQIKTELENFLHKFETDSRNADYQVIIELVNLLVARREWKYVSGFAAHCLNHPKFWDKEIWVDVLTLIEDDQPVCTYFLNNLHLYKTVEADRFLVEKLILAFVSNTEDMGDHILFFLHHPEHLVKHAALTYIGIKNLVQYQEELLQLFDKTFDYNMLNIAPVICKLGVTAGVELMINKKIYELKESDSITPDFCDDTCTELRNILTRYQKCRPSGASE